jgi:hypothetical protein
MNPGIEARSDELGPSFLRGRDVENDVRVPTCEFDQLGARTIVADSGVTSSRSRPTGRSFSPTI